MSEKESVIFGRHSERADGAMGRGNLPEGWRASEDYPSLTENGVERARELARTQFTEMIDKADEGSIVFIGGSSEEERTKDTAAVIGETLGDHYEDSDDVVVVTRSCVEELRGQARQQGERKVIDDVQAIIDENPGRKVVVTYPLYLKELSLRPHQRKKETGEHTEYMKELLEQTDYDEERAAREWFDNEGEIRRDEKVLRVPSPQETAETHVQGINRVREFTRRFAGDRSVHVGVVAHGWQLDALAVYLANRGEVNREAFEEVTGGRAMEQPEAGSLEIREDRATFRFRGEDYDVPKELIDE